MGMTATFLDLLQVPLDKSFKGRSIFSNGKSFVISESAGAVMLIFSEKIFSSLLLTITIN